MVSALLLVAVAASDGPATAESRAEICVERPESTGVLNIRVANVVIERGPTIALLGGQSACAFVPVGKHVIWVQSGNPYDPPPS